MLGYAAEVKQACCARHVRAAIPWRAMTLSRMPYMCKNTDLCSARAQIHIWPMQVTFVTFIRAGLDHDLHMLGSKVFDTK